MNAHSASTAENEFLIHPEEYHGWRRPSHRLLQQLYLMAWFEKYMVKKDGGDKK
ncbi:MAG: hypothetical protein QHH14_12845 [Clostridiales bacterium]|nr:hypothetical protein [Clostridiales bacterium]